MQSVCQKSITNIAFNAKRLKLLGQGQHVYPYSPAQCHVGSPKEKYLPDKKK